MSTLTWPKFRRWFSTKHPGAPTADASSAWLDYKAANHITAGPKASANRSPARKTSAGRGRGKARSPSPVHVHVYGDRAAKKVSAPRAPSAKAKPVAYKGTPIGTHMQPAPVTDLRSQRPAEVKLGKLTIKLPATIWKDAWIPVVQAIASEQPTDEKIYGHVPLFTKADGHWPDTADLYKEASHKNATPLAFVAQFFDPRPDSERGKGASKGTRFVQVFTTTLAENEQEYRSLVRKLDLSQPEKVIAEPPNVPNATHAWNDADTGRKAARKGYKIVGWELRSETSRERLYALVDALKKANLDRSQLVEDLEKALADMGAFQYGQNAGDSKRPNQVKVGGYMDGQQGNSTYEAFLQNVYYYEASGNRVSIVIRDDGETLQGW
jgi:hypothetical protein